MYVCVCACVRVCAFVFALLFRQLVASLLRFLLHTVAHTLICLVFVAVRGVCVAFVVVAFATWALWSLNEFFSLPRLVVFNCFMRSLVASPVRSFVCVASALRVCTSLFLCFCFCLFLCLSMDTVLSFCCCALVVVSSFSVFILESIPQCDIALRYIDNRYYR